MIDPARCAWIAASCQPQSDRNSRRTAHLEPVGQEAAQASVLVLTPLHRTGTVELLAPLRTDLGTDCRVLAWLSLPSDCGHDTLARIGRYG